MTQAGLERLFTVLELYQILLQTVIVFVLWRIVFRTRKEKSDIIAATLFVAMSFAARLPFSTPWVRYIASIVFAGGYCFIRYRKYYEKAIFVLLLCYNFHSLSALISISLYQKLQNVMYYKLQNAVDQKLQNVMIENLEFIKSDALNQLSQISAVNGVILYMIYTFIIIFMVAILVKILKNVNVIDWRDAVIFSVYSLSGGILTSIVMDLIQVKVGDAVFYLYDTKKEMFWKIPLVAGCIFVGEIVLIYFWKNYKALLDEKQKHFVEEKQIKAMKQRLEEAEGFYGNVRKVRHEMKNHMTNIKGLAAGEQYEEIAGYIQKIDETMQELEYKYVTGNAVTDVIVNDKWRMAEKLGIHFEADFQYSGEISAFDIGMILSNLLDNALEACGKIEQEKRFIHIVLKRKKQFLLIDVENSFDGTINLPDDGKLPVSTKDGNAPGMLMEHGIGLKNVSDIAERYYGGVNIKVKDKVFHITVMLQQGGVMQEF